MRWLLTPAALACLLACAEWRMPPTFPRDAQGRPVVHEQALVGLSDAGDALVAELIDADGEEPRLLLRWFDSRGAQSRTELAAPAEVALAAALDLRARGRTRTPLLQAELPRLWPQALERARALGYLARAPAAPDPLGRAFAVWGVAGLGPLPLALRLDDGDPGALLLMMTGRGGGESADEIELTRASLSGERVGPQVWIHAGTVWLLAGSFLAEPPLHRAVGLRHASLARGEAQLHNQHGLADYAAGDLDAARREFDRALVADGGFVDALYNAASTAALADRDEEAVALLRRAAQADPARVQVLGRSDEDLKSLRKRADVRALLGLRRPPREDIPPPP